MIPKLHSYIMILKFGASGFTNAGLEIRGTQHERLHNSQKRKANHESIALDQSVQELEGYQPAHLASILGITLVCLLVELDIL